MPRHIRERIDAWTMLSCGLWPASASPGRWFAGWCGPHDATPPANPTVPAPRWGSACRISVGAIAILGPATRAVRVQAAPAETEAAVSASRPAYFDPVVCDKPIGRHREVGAGRAAAHAPGEIEPGGMAAAKPAILVVARERVVRLQSAAEVRADAHDHQPFRLPRMRAVGIAGRGVHRQRGIPRMRIEQFTEWNITRKVHFDRRAMPDDDRLGFPPDDNRLSGTDRREIHQDRSRRRRRIGARLSEQRPRRHGAARGGERAGADEQEVAPGRVAVLHRIPARMKLCTNWRWNSRKPISSGAEVIRVAAQITAQSMP